MIRILIFIGCIVLFAGAATALLGLDGWIEGRIFGARYDIHAGFAALGLMIVLICAMALTSFIKDLRRVPSAVGTRKTESRHAAGLKAMARGFEAIAAGDARAADKHARAAQRFLDDPASTRLLAAQAAQLSGHNERAKDAFTLMLQSPETEAPALRGLYLQARQDGEFEEAWRLAESAFERMPHARWVYDAVFQMGLERFDWAKVRDAVAAAAKHKLIAPEIVQRAETALLAAQAHEAAEHGDIERATAFAQAALKIRPGFAPAAVLVAKHHLAADRPSRAAKLLERAFEIDACPAIAAMHARLYETDDIATRVAALERLAAANPKAREASLALVRRDILSGEQAQALRRLEPLLAAKPRAREFLLTAEAVYPRDPAAARPWLLRAASAPDENAPGADGEFRLTKEGWARLVRQYTEYGRLAPPPLEAGPAGVSADEMKQLSGPPAQSASIHPDEPQSTSADISDGDDTSRIVGAAGQVS